MQKPAMPQPFAAKNYAFTEYVNIKNWIGGAWRDGSSGNWLDIENPRHGKTIGKMTISTTKDVDAAVEAAKKAFPAWRATPMRERAQVLMRLKVLMERDLDELCWLVSHENGKTYAEGKGDVEKGIECVEFAASLHMMADGGQLDVSRGVNCRVTHEPLGVVAGIVPFNFPVMVPLWMAPNAIMAGNAFILKPSEVVPYGAMKLAALFQEAGLPDGIFNVVNGQRECVEAIVDHADIKAVGFVGSTKVAKILYARGAATGKRMLCLGSAKNHVVVVPDADVALTSTNIVASSYGCAGQRCMASSLMVAVGDVQKIIDGIADNVRKIRLGDDMGSIISAASRERILKYIEEAEKAGAKVLVDGRGQKVDGAGGHWIGPTVLDNVTSRCLRAAKRSSGRCSPSCTPRRSMRPSTCRTRACMRTARPSSPPRASSRAPRRSASRPAWSASTSACPCRVSRSASVASTPPSSATATSRAGMASASGAAPRRSPRSGPLRPTRAG